jgi:hypothetical protein
VSPLIRRPSFPLAVAALLLAGCSSVPITPARVREAATTTPEARLAIERWETAVEIANAFLASPYRRTLPAGRYTLTDDGTTFQAATGACWPMRVRYDAIGQVCATFGFAAQERTDGFAVGKAPPKKNILTDNTFFRTRSGEELPPAGLAGLLLHETTHVVLRDGTVNVPKSIAYYAEAVFLLRSRTLSAERRPYATSEEFDRFLRSHGQDGATQARMLREFEEHLAQGPTKYCRHGPFDIPAPPYKGTPPPPDASSR